MFDSVQCQEDLTDILLATESLYTVNIKSYRRMVKDKEIDMSVIWNKPRGNCAGAGMLIEEPEAKSAIQNVDGPVLSWIFPILVIEQPIINFLPGVGSFLTASIIGQRVMEALHKWGDQLYGMFKVDGAAMQPDESWFDRGVVAYRTNLALDVGKAQQTQRTGNVSIVFGGGNCTLACASDPTADVFYTTDGTGAARFGATSKPYQGPFSVLSGDVIRATAFITGKLPSNSNYQVVP